MGLLENIKESIDLVRKVVALTPVDHLIMVTYLNNLRLALLLKFEWIRSMEDLNESIDILRKSVLLISDNQPHHLTYTSAPQGHTATLI